MNKLANHRHAHPGLSYQLRAPDDAINGEPKVVQHVSRKAHELSQVSVLIFYAATKNTAVSARAGGTSPALAAHVFLFA